MQTPLSTIDQVTANPPALWRQLSSFDHQLIDELCYLSRQQAKRSPSGAHYCVPGRAYLAEKCGVHVDTITRHTTRLRDLGVLQKVQRRPVRGKWRTCLYRIVAPAAWALSRVFQRLRAVGSRPTFRADKASPSVNQQLANHKVETLSQILARGRAKWGNG